MCFKCGVLFQNILSQFRRSTHAINPMLTHYISNVGLLIWADYSGQFSPLVKSMCRPLFNIHLHNLRQDISNEVSLLHQEPTCSIRSISLPPVSCWICGVSSPSRVTSFYLLSCRQNCSIESLHTLARATTGTAQAMDFLVSDSVFARLLSSHLLNSWIYMCTILSPNLTNSRI